MDLDAGVDEEKRGRPRTRREYLVVPARIHGHRRRDSPSEGRRGRDRITRDVNVSKSPDPPPLRPHANSMRTESRKPLNEGDIEWKREENFSTSAK